MSGIGLQVQLFISTAALVQGMSYGAGPVEVRVHCGGDAGRIRAFHGLNCGPLTDGGMVDLTAEYRALGVPFVRLHDCHLQNPDVVDMHAVFPDPAADPELPESYDFARTDDYLDAIEATGARIVFRLGESIEHTPRKYRVNPPADPARWARACLGIIRHCNEGWAGGRRRGIRYWEIWNEPENRPPMWTGTDEQYFELYSRTAKAIKAAYPELMVGGPAVGDSGRCPDGVYGPSEFMVRFAEHCRNDQAPLDFFSWHVYTNDPEEVVRRARGVRAFLDERGFTETESHLNEWNYLPDNDWEPMFPAGQGARRKAWFERVAGTEGAAFTVTVLAKLQEVPLDMSVYYRGEVGGFSLFDPYGTPTDAYHAMLLFSLLQRETPRRLPVESDAGEVAVCAGRDESGDRFSVLVARRGTGDADVSIRLPDLPPGVPYRGSIRRVEAGHNPGVEQPVAFDAATPAVQVTVSGHAVALIRLVRGND